MKKLVYGVGYNDVVGGYKTQEYKHWIAMLKRCYSDEYQAKQPSYIGCTVSDEFKIFSNFKKWCNEQIGFGFENSHLDKDILVKGNKKYSSAFCCFVPRRVNCIFEKCKSSRGKYPIGVYFDKHGGCFRAYIRDDGKFKQLGRFDNEWDAFNKYKKEKENLIKISAEKHRELIRKDVYQAMMVYVVSAND